MDSPVALAQFQWTGFSTLINQSAPFRCSLISAPGHYPRIPGNQSQHECRHILRNPTQQTGVFRHTPHICLCYRVQSFANNTRTSVSRRILSNEFINVCLFTCRSRFCLLCTHTSLPVHVVLQTVFLDKFCLEYV